jgi:ATP-dependent helicase/nuclease subunit B
LDYKTGDAPRKPEATHREKDGNWTDLQLPLYRHLVRAIGVDGPISLGYIVLPKDAKQAGLLEAKWSDADLEEADEVAADVIRTVRAGRFERMAPVPPPFSEDFAAICRDNVLGRWASAHAEEEAE